ncbi:dihydrolipoyl dehydrogenase family protein [Enterococcus villorum]|uniref:Glutathione reductase n=2 Tax=Enterococcus villorum TaxID=112904 RepID=A0A511J2C8_9ENTE|nr:NAD(P)/FAD-dependent oxidoreductase [Enterococcus villorum]EOH89584.1 pyridine nucleotide-disulfide oxidoreductase [Enterococcus villorum ATCC 700913]EOW78256.1 pyridine nucleotide-disulfide oxidoreductase [Enterococcus villorum ATCC 700913]GEL92104.1 glutathione reductase [Enterococcus villorum]
MKKYDEIVIGSGVAGLSAAYGLKEAGKQVLVIEENLWGGTCPNRGCDPKKILLNGLETKKRVEQLLGKGFSKVPLVDWQALQAFKRTFTDPVSKNRQAELASADIDYLSGKAHFINEHTIVVGEETITATHFVLATGQRPAILPIEGNQYLQTSTDFLSLTELPEEIIFIGAGYVAFELAMIAHAAGSKVTIVHHNQRPLKAFEEKLVKQLVEQMERAGIQFVFDFDSQRIVKVDDRYQLQSQIKELQADAIFCATGRQPNIERLNLEAANVEVNKQGIVVNEYLQTTNPIIFACGDIVARTEPKLTPVATFEGNYIADYLTKNSAEKISYPNIPTIVFTSPKLAQVGIIKNQLTEKHQLEEIDMTSWFTYRRENEPIARAQLIYDTKGYLVGASVLSEHADDLINTLNLLINQKMRKKDLTQMIMGYPTLASDLSYLLK